MSSKIEQIIEEIEEYIDGCKPQTLSKTNIIVNKEEIEELLRELRMKTPEEIKRYQNVLANRDAILADAQAKAAAEAEAQKRLDAATIEANNFRMQAMRYTDDMLGNLQNLVRQTMEGHAARYESMMNSLNNFNEILASNRAELGPAITEQPEEEAPEEDQ